MKKIKIIAISDTHTREIWLDIPKCDILLFCGDFNIKSKADLEYANCWFDKQKATTKIFVAGNHDGYLVHLGRKRVKKLFSNVTYLEDEMVEVAGLKIYGSPWSPEFNNWAFMYPRYSLEAEKIWAKIPENLDILATHCPPYGILDRNSVDIRCGCDVLLRAIIDKKPKNHIFGHIHSWGGQSITQKEVNLYNVSVLNEGYNLVNPPTIIEV